MSATRRAPAILLLGLGVSLAHASPSFSSLSRSTCTSRADYAPRPTHPIRLRHVAFAAGGGFGGGAGGFGASSSKSKKSKKKKGKRGGSLLGDDIMTKPKQQPKAEVKEKGPELDRFGLPVPTEADILPPLPKGTELIPVDVGYQTKMEDIRSAMEKHIQLDYDLFDENGIEKVSEGDDREPMKLKLLHKSPPVLAIENFFTADECDEYIELSIPKDNDNNEALKVDSKTFALSMATRTSTTWFCHYRQVPTLLAKASRLLNDLPIERMEEPQLVRYRTGEEFSYHYDEVPPPQLGNGGQRVATLLVYLRTLEEGRGGATEFRDLRGPSGEILAMRPEKGSALLFFPAFGDGTPDDRTLHKGEVAVDEKMIGQIWVHERQYKPVIPEGNSHGAAKGPLSAKKFELGYSQK